MNIFYKSVILFLLLFVFQQNITAQQYPVTNYTKDRGLPGNQVWDIYQDSRGYMWFATSAGLVKYNGKEYKFYGKKDGLLNDWPLGITGNKDSVLWVSSERGVSSLKNGKVHTWLLREAEDRIKLFTDSYNRVWAYSTLFPGDIFYFLQDSLHNFSSENNFKNQTILNIAEDNEGGIYFLTRPGKLYKYFADKIKEISIAGFSDEKINYFFIDSESNLIICAGKGIGFINSESLNPGVQIKWISDVPAKYGIQNKNGKYWFAVIEKGLLRLNTLNSTDPNLFRITEKNGLLSNDVKLVYADRENDLWIGYDLKGVSKISTVMFHKYDKAEGLDANAVFSIQKHNGSFFCTTEKGIFKLKDSEFTRITSPEKFSKRWFTCLLPVNENEMLAGSAPGLYEIKNGSSIDYLGLDNKIIQTIIKDHSGRIWIGTHEGLYTFEGGTFIKQDFDVSDRSIFKLIESGEKDLYIGTDKGLYITENATSPLGRKTVIHPGQSKRNQGLTEFISDIAVDSDSAVIIAERNGVTIIPPGREPYKVESLNDNEIISLLVDSNKNLWAGTTRGVFELHKFNDIYTVVKSYSKSEGLASDEFSFNNTIYEDSDGKIYFGMFGGVSIYDPSEDYSLTQKPGVYISGLQINNNSFPLTSGTTLQLSFNQNKVSFNCDGLSFFNEDGVSFEYYLYPVEDEWSNVSRSSKITYGYLEPDQYTFYVRAANQFGIMSDVRSVSFTISPPFWKRSWFIALAVLLLVSAGYSFNYYRQTSIRKRNLLLEKIVKEKTKDLNESKTQVEHQYNQLIDAQKELVEKRELEKAHSEIQLLKERLAKENIYLREKQGIIQEVSSIIGRSSAIQEVRKKVVEIAGTSSTVLITGSTGVGKNLVAEAIHDLSSRRDRALIVVNCAAIPDSLVESELFGHEKGSFTGAVEKQEGKFEMADGSTIFLDEIGDMPLPVQAKLLNVIQSRKFMRIGGNKELSVDVRIIAATNHNIAELVEQGRFRRDLFYRINVYTIAIPSLEERPDDIEPLAKYFIGRFSMMMNKKITAISKSALSILHGYSYPGNIRELENIIHRAVIICKADTITDEEILISPVIHKSHHKNNGDGDLVSLQELEFQYISQVLEKTGWKIRGEGGAAEILKIDPGTLRSRMKKLGIPFIAQKKS